MGWPRRRRRGCRLRRGHELIDRGDQLARRAQQIKIENGSIELRAAQLKLRIMQANQRIIAGGGRGFVENAILGPLKAKRAAVIDRIGIAISRRGGRPAGLDAFAACAVNGAVPGPSASGPWTVVPDGSTRVSERTVE